MRARATRVNFASASASRHSLARAFRSAFCASTTTRCALRRRARSSFSASRALLCRERLFDFPFPRREGSDTRSSRGAGKAARAARVRANKAEVDRVEALFVEIRKQRAAKKVQDELDRLDAEAQKAVHKAMQRLEAADVANNCLRFYAEQAIAPLLALQRLPQAVEVVEEDDEESVDAEEEYIRAEQQRLNDIVYAPFQPRFPDDDQEDEIVLSISREGEEVFRGSTALSQLKRGYEELAGFLFRENDFPDGALLMTGTGIVPDHPFTLQPNDLIRISIDGIGTLENTVVMADDLQK